VYQEPLTFAGASPAAAVTWSSSARIVTSSPRPARVPPCPPRHQG